MNKNLFGALRVLLLLYIIGMVVMLCYAERETIPTPTNPPTKAPVTRQSQASEQWKNLGSFRITAYCPCEICCGEWAIDRPKDKQGNPIIYTASGAIAEAGTTIAVDPTIIPYGTKVKINEHTYTAEDCGGAIKGNRIDIYFDTHEEATKFGVRNFEIFVRKEINYD